MARQVRIEYPGAVYHCMARGNRREEIVSGDGDREAFVALLEELVGRTGWRMFAWVLMGNHYHLVFKTPEPNLVEGMKWLQNTWTKRFNARNGYWGHVFGGRYKSVVVEENEHLAVLIDYVHLNPFRAGLIKKGMGLEDYPWSSLGDYLSPARKRRGWVRVEDGLKQRMYSGDHVRERRRYLKHLEEVALSDGGHPKLPGDGERSLQSSLRRGWYLGAEEYREKLLTMLEARKKKGGHRRVSGYTGDQQRDHGEAMAERIVVAGLDELGLSEEDLAGMKKGDWRKRVIGRVVREKTAIRLTWLAERLKMGNVSRASKLVSSAPGADWGSGWRGARKPYRALVKKTENLD